MRGGSKCCPCCYCHKLQWRLYCAGINAVPRNWITTVTNVINWMRQGIDPYKEFN